MESATPWYRVGVDIGGTFTDVVFLSALGDVHVRKTVSTPDDYSRAVLEALGAGLRELDLEAGSLTEVSHAFTLATNAILEGRGVRTALITTEGFRDVLEISRLRMPRTLRSLLSQASSARGTPSAVGRSGSASTIGDEC